MVDVPVAVVIVLPSLLVPVEKRVSVEMGVEPPLPPLPLPPTAVKWVDALTSVVNVLPALLVPVEKKVSVEIGEEEPPLPAPDAEVPPPPVALAELPEPPEPARAVVAAKGPTELPALEAEAEALLQYELP
jgi:hypothetical protein